MRGSSQIIAEDRCRANPAAAAGLDAAEGTVLDRHARDVYDAPNENVKYAVEGVTIDDGVIPTSAVDMLFLPGFLYIPIEPSIGQHKLLTSKCMAVP